MKERNEQIAADLNYLCDKLVRSLSFQISTNEKVDEHINMYESMSKLVSDMVAAGYGSQPMKISEKDVFKRVKLVEATTNSFKAKDELLTKNYTYEIGTHNDSPISADIAAVITKDGTTLIHNLNAGCATYMVGDYMKILELDDKQLTKIEKAAEKQIMKDCPDYVKEIKVLRNTESGSLAMIEKEN